MVKNFKADEIETSRVVRRSPAEVINDFMDNHLVASALGAAGLLVGVMLIMPEEGKDSQDQDRQDEQGGQNTEALERSQEDIAYAEAFFANVTDHEPRAVCTERISAFGGDLQTIADMQGVEASAILAESPFSHWYSIASGTDGEVVDRTARLSSVDIAPDSLVAGMEPGTNLVCDDNSTSEVSTFVDSERLIYPSGNPEVSLVQDIINGTISVRRSGQTEDGDRLSSSSSAVYIGNGVYLSPHMENSISYTYQNGEAAAATVDTATIHGFEFDESFLGNTLGHFDGRYSFIHTERTGPEIQLAGTEDIQPGDTLIVAGYDENEPLNEDEVRFMYRVVVLERRDTGELVVATEVEDSGSYDAERYHPHYGSYGAGVFRVDGDSPVLVGTLGTADSYRLRYEYDPPSEEGEEESWANNIINYFSYRFGVPSPQEIYDGDDNLAEPEIHAVAFINPLPITAINEVLGVPNE